LLPAAARGGEPDLRRFGAVIAPVNLVPADPDPLSVPELNDFFGTIELKSASDGLVLVNRLPLERYLLGLNEVPTDWPMEALRAQAVAARTYVLYGLTQPRAGAADLYGFDICASVECQVFSGADVVQTLEGRRWQQAVESTQGEVVLYDGRPILARYHSTSGGRTLENSKVFTDEPRYPYLKPVPSTTEKSAPLYRWTVRFRLSHLQSILERAGWWTRGHGRLASVETRESSSGWHYPDVVMKGSRRHLTKTAQELRETLAALAPQMYPDRYPSPANTSSGALPETLPSNRFEIVTQDKNVIVRGRGWGHGVGMSQWGAHGMAEEGATYKAILEHYYKGVTVESVAAPRATIDVGVKWGLPSVAVHGDFEIVDGRGRTIVKNALGTWIFHSAGPGAISIDPPAGRGVRLEVGIVRSPERVDAGTSAEIVVALTKPAHVWTQTRGPEERKAEDPQVRNAGKQPVSWRAPLEPGRYEVRIEASSGPRHRLSEPVKILVQASERQKETEPESRERPADPDRDGGGLLFIVLVVLLVLAVIAVGVAGRMRRYGDDRREPSYARDD
jgi:stage II sporulation protein D